MGSSDPESVAGRWFVLRAEYEQIGPLRAGWLVVRGFFVGLFLWGLNLGEFDPERFCDVLVLRRDTGAVVATYSYHYLSGADLEVERLRVMLASTQVFDFCRELGLGTDAVVGPGVSTSWDPDEVWSPIPAGRRRATSF